MSVKLLTEYHLKFLSLKGGCTGSCQSTLVKMPHCWKFQVTAHLVCLSFKEYKKQFEKALEKIADEKQKLIIAEERWMESWNTSVEKVKQLY